MEVFGSFWASLALLLLSLAIGAIMTALLYNKQLRVRWLAWVFYVLSMIYPAMVLINVFFVNILSLPSLRNDFEIGQLALAQMALVSLIGIIFFNVVWFEFRRQPTPMELSLAKIGKIMFFIFLLFLILLTGYSAERLIQQGINRDDISSVSDLSSDSPIEIPQDTIKIIPCGGSLCGTLKMDIKEAHHYANLFKIKHYWHDGVFYVLVYPGERFMKVGDFWLPIEK